MLLGDFHCHTKYSDGKNTLEQMIEAAYQKGLTQLGITDHGLRHVFLGTSREKLKKARIIIDKLRPSYPNMEIYLSIESNIYGSDGTIDLTPPDYDLIDYVCAGYHIGTWPKNIIDMFRYNVAGFTVHKTTERQKRVYTNATISAIKKGRLNFLTHPCYKVDIDAKQVGRACADYGVLVELNGKKVSMSDEAIMQMQQEGAHFIINSDAHSVDRVGDFSHPLEVANRVGLDMDRVENWNKKIIFVKR